jgi:fatty acid amide hydrolase
VAKLPKSLRPAVATALRVIGDALPARIVKVTHEKTVAELWRITNALRRYRFDLLQAMDAARIDVILCPAHATTALPHGMSKDFPIAGSFSMLWNAVQFPGGVVPVTRVRDDEAMRPGARGRWETHAEKIDRASAGLPVGVQVVARPWKDEEVLATMIAIERALEGDVDHPKTPIDPR